MILITGGAAQGKAAFARERFPDCHMIPDFQEVIRAALAAGRDPYEEAMKMAEDPQAVVLLDEVGCGVVPMDAFDRTYRETVGRVGCFLAERAGEVWRVILGIGTRIK